MISEAVYDLCHSPASVSSELAKAPSAKPADILADLFSRPLKDGVGNFVNSNGNASSSSGKANASSDLTRARECGTWGAKEPSDLFLRIFHDALSMLNENSLAGLVSPSLMGSPGTVPLTIIGPLPDITRHMSNCIARAQKEVILVTSYWMHSNNSRLITNAMRELSDRAGKRGEKVVMKIMYDRANMKHFSRSRDVVQPKEAASPRVQLPAQEEIPNIDLQAINCHDAFLGTLHSKYMIVDRRLALLMSSNIQDNDNLEMMVRVEGPIVDSFYDTFLISWNIALEPPLPMLDSPARDAEPPSLKPKTSKLSSVINGAKIHPFGPDTTRETHLSKFAEHTAESPNYDSSIVEEAKRINASLTPRKGESRQEAVTRHLNIVERPDITGNAPEWTERDHMTPYILHTPHEPFPMAMVNREPYGGLSNTSVRTPQNAAFLAAINNAKSTLFIQTPDLNAEPLLEPLLNAVRRGVIVTCYLCLGYNDSGELLPFQNGTNEMTSNRLYNSLATEEEKSRLRIYNYIGKDQTKPIHNKFKKRSCHIKLMIIDERVAIQGCGNLDTQSFYHSQETNLLLDSPQICGDWLDALARNQNTATYGAVSKKDGCWRDPDTGEIAVGSMGIDPGRFGWVKGIVGAVNRVRGAGGF